MKTSGILDKIGAVMIVFGLLAFIFTSLGWLVFAIVIVGVVFVMAGVAVRLREDKNKGNQ